MYCRVASVGDSRGGGRKRNNSHIQQAIQRSYTIYLHTQYRAVVMTAHSRAHFTHTHTHRNSSPASRPDRQSDDRTAGGTIPSASHHLPRWSSIDQATNVALPLRSIDRPAKARERTNRMSIAKRLRPIMAKWGRGEYLPMSPIGTI